MITQEYLKENLSYDPNTGSVQWVRRKKGRTLGVEAGTIFRSSNKAKQQYKRLWIDGRNYRVHRLIWLYMHGSWPKNQIDHINGDGLDNRICNLRDVTNSENHKNRRLGSDNTTGVTGVYRHHGKWIASIGSKGNLYYLGYFDRKKDAAAARKAAELKYDFHASHGRKHKAG